MNDTLSVRVKESHALGLCVSGHHGGRVLWKTQRWEPVSDTGWDPDAQNASGHCDCLMQHAHARTTFGVTCGATCGAVV